MDSSNIAGDWTQRTHDLAADEPEPVDSAWPNPADGLVEYSRRFLNAPLEMHPGTGVNSAPFFSANRFGAYRSMAEAGL